MSLFLLEQKQLLKNIQSSQQEKQIKSEFSEYLTHNYHKGLKPVLHQQLTTISSQVQSQINQQHTLFDIPQMGSRFKALYSGKFSPDSKKVSFTMRILVPNQGYFKIINGFCMTQIFNEIAQMTAENKNMTIKIVANPNTREIKIVLPEYFGREASFLHSYFKSKTSKQLAVYQKILKPHIGSIIFLLKKILNEDQLFQNQGNVDQKHQKQLSILCKYSKLSNTMKNFKIDGLFNTEEQIKQFNLKSCKEIKQTIIDNAYLHNLSDFYGLKINKTKNSKDFQFTQSQINWIKRKFENTFDSKDQQCILNYIYLKDQNSIKMNKVNQGGFTNIYTADVKYWQIKSVDMIGKAFKLEQQQFTQETLKEQTVAIKKPIPSFFQQEQQQDNSLRIKREIEIIKKMKDQRPTFIPKYYIVCNNSKMLNQCVLMDYIDDKTLQQFLQDTKFTLSLSNKLFIMFAIIQALRKIRSHQIVHLDLKPTNILMSSKSIVKIIDFGQSYHPKLSGQDFVPGYSIPYSSPELYRGQYKYTTDSDVYSLGVIFYEILYNKCPFNLHTSTMLFDQSKQNFEELWLFTPQQAETYGKSYIFRILSSLIGKCLASKAQQRPQLDWLAVTIRRLIEIIN